MPRTHTDTPLQLAANTIRGLAIDAVQRANSGHPGMPMGMADVAAVLWLEVLRHSPHDPRWLGRDRFVLSAGHGSMLLYALLHLAGYDVSLDDLRQFRQLHSRTPGHPEYGETPGVETTTGPLGQGFANGVGMALGARMAAARFGNPLLEARVFGIVSDGDLMEGVAQEAASLAGHLALGNLVYLYDDNRITIDGRTELSYSDDARGRFEALGWRVSEVDGHDHDAIRRVLRDVCASRAAPALVVCRTTIGKGSPGKQDSAAAHGSPLGKDEVARTKQALGLPAEEMWVPDEVRDAFRARNAANESARERWQAEHAAWCRAHPDAAAKLSAFVEGHTPTDLLDQLVAAAGSGGATRALSGKVVQRAAALVPGLVGGSADLDGSCKTWIKDSPAVSRGDLRGRNLHFGVREHAMGGILNGLALSGGYRPVGSTFLVFSDYMRPAIRLAALMRVPSTFVFSHDSLLVGEDGPTHQPVEHVASLRLIPNLHVYRPADGREVAAAWAHAMTRRQGPVAILLTRQDVPVFEPSPAHATQFARGGHVVHEPQAPAIATVIATGAEVAPTVAAARTLGASLPLRVVSMPCVELFLDQDRAWRDAVVAPGLPVFAIEMGRPEIWCRFTGSVERVLGVERFGLSAPAEAIASEFGFTADAIAEFLRTALQR